MLTISIIIIVCIFIIISLFIFFNVHSNRIKVAIIKVDESKSQIKKLLNKKNELLISINKNLDNNKVLNGIEEVSDIVSTDFEYYDLLNKFYRKLYDFINNDDNNNDDNNNDDNNIEKIFLLLKDEEEALNGCIKYYNDKVYEYNEIISSFTIKIISVIHGYKAFNLFNIDNQ